MNFSMFWPESKRPIKKKRIKPKSKFLSSLLVTSGTEEEHSINSMDEVRRQAVSMSRSALAPSTSSRVTVDMQNKKPRVKVKLARQRQNKIEG